MNILEKNFYSLKTSFHILLKVVRSELFILYLQLKSYNLTANRISKLLKKKTNFSFRLVINLWIMLLIIGYNSVINVKYFFV